MLDNDKGQTRRAWMENHYGFPEGIGGPDLVDAGQKQAVRLGAQWVTEQVTGVQKEGEGMGLAFAAGREPRYAKVVQVDGDGRTSQPGVWAAGILAGASAHTIITAGDGARVAVNLISELQGKRHVQHDAMSHGPVCSGA